MSLAAGRLRHRVRIEQITTEQDSDGNAIETWADFVGSPVPAEIAPLSGREFIAAAATQSKVTARITIRHRPGIAPSMRVVHRDTTYNIEAVLPDPRSGIRHLTLLCSYGVNQG